MILFRDRKRYAPVLYEYEDHFEQIAAKHLSLELPDFWVLPFKHPVLGDDGVRRRADLALVHRSYRMWVVVEVELEHHDLERHVFPQLKTLATGAYDVEHARSLARGSDMLDPAELERMVSYTQPKIAVLVNSRAVVGKGWGMLEDDLGVELSFLETFRSSDGDAIFALSGYVPRMRPERIAGAKKQALMNALTTRVPIPAGSGGKLQMESDGRMIDWDTISTADATVLIPRQPITLREDRNYEILRSKDGRLVLNCL